MSRFYINFDYVQVVPFKDPELVEEIHRTFRMQYMKDVALARSIDEFTFATINSLIYLNNIAIVSRLIEDKKFISRLYVPPVSFHFLSSFCFFLFTNIHT
jgi:protein phosphatase-4 regulatory subunit 3